MLSVPIGLRLAAGSDVSHRLIAVHAVIDGDESDILMRKKDLGIIA